jgi:hypothetical protein
MGDGARASTPVRLAELVATLSLAGDLGLGQPMEHLARSCLIAVRLAERIGLDDADREVVYHLALLAWLGCTADSHELAALFGDDLTFGPGPTTSTSAPGRCSSTCWPGPAPAGPPGTGRGWSPS